MTKTTDLVAINDWQVIGRTNDFQIDQSKTTQLLGQSLIAERKKKDTWMNTYARKCHE